MVMFQVIKSNIGKMSIPWWTHNSNLRTFFLDGEHGQTNGTTNETWTHSWRFASLAYEPLQQPRGPVDIGLNILH